MMTAILITLALVSVLTLVAVGVATLTETAANHLRKHFAGQGIARYDYIMREYGVFAVVLDGFVSLVSAEEIQAEMDLEAQARKADAFIRAWESAQVRS